MYESGWPSPGLQETQWLTPGSKGPGIKSASKPAPTPQPKKEKDDFKVSSHVDSAARFYQRKTRLSNWEFLLCPLYVLYFVGVLFAVSNISCDPDLKREFFNDKSVRLVHFIPAFSFLTVSIELWITYIQDYNPFKRSLAYVMCCIHIMSAIVEIFAFTGRMPVFRDGFGRLLAPHHYVGWMHTTPVMVYVLTHVSSRSNRAVLSTTLRLVLMFPCGLASVTTLPSSVRICTGICSFALFASVLYDLLDLYREVRMSVSDKDAAKSVRFLALAKRLSRAIGIQTVFIAVTWTAFPVVWLASNAGLLTSVQQEVLLCVMNFLSKVLFAHSALATVCMQLGTEMNVQAIVDLEHVYQQESFLQSVGHEMRTPLDGIIGLSDTLMNADSMNDKQRKFMSLIKNAGMQLLGIIDDILDVRASKTGTLPLALETIDVAELLNNVVAVLTPLKRAEVSLTAEIQGHLPPMRGDNGRITQVFTNLVGNALKFTHQGQVRINATFDSFERMIVVRVIDSGIGIPANRIGALFQEFSQIGSHITRNYGGTGLGLSISKQLVEAHGGTITATSQEGRGSIFTVRLPTVAKFAPAVHLRRSIQREEDMLALSLNRGVLTPPPPPNLPYIRGFDNMSDPWATPEPLLGGPEPRLPSSAFPEYVKLAARSDLYDDSSSSRGPVSGGIFLPPGLSSKFESSGQEKATSRLGPSPIEYGPNTSRAGADPFADELPAPPPTFAGRGATQKLVEEGYFQASSLRKRNLSFRGHTPSKSGGGGGGTLAGSRNVATAGSKRTFYRFANEGRLLALSTDDDPVNQMVIEEILATSSFEVETARSGEECLRSLQSSPYLPDVLLLDVMMPGMSGLEVLEKIRGNPSLKDLPVVLCSALDSANFIREAQRLGCNGFVTKPINRASLLNVLQRCLPELSEKLRR